MRTAASALLSLVAPEEAVRGLVISIGEILANAYVHGNKKDEALPILLQIDSSARTIVARVTDRGEGFEPEELPLPETEAEHGRGVMLARVFADRLSYHRTRQGFACLIVVKA